MRSQGKRPARSDAERFVGDGQLASLLKSNKLIGTKFPLRLWSISEAEDWSKQDSDGVAMVRLRLPMPQHLSGEI